MATLNTVVVLWTALLFYWVFQATIKASLPQGEPVSSFFVYAPLISIGYISVLSAFVLLPYVIESYNLIVNTTAGGVYLIDILEINGALWRDLHTSSLQKIGARPLVWAALSHFIARALGRLSVKCKF